MWIFFQLFGRRRVAKKKERKKKKKKKKLKQHFFFARHQRYPSERGSLGYNSTEVFGRLVLIVVFHDSLFWKKRKLLKLWNHFGRIDAKCFHCGYALEKLGVVCQQLKRIPSKVDLRLMLTLGTHDFKLLIWKVKQWHIGGGIFPKKQIHSSEIDLSIRFNI